MMKLNKITHTEKYFMNFIDSDCFKTFSLIIWTIAVFSYYFQFPFSRISVLLVPMLSLFAILQLPSFLNYMKKCKVKKIYYLFVLYLVMEFMFSLHNGVSFSRILRFFFILIIIPYVSTLTVNSDKYEKIFILLSMIKSIILITIAFYLVVEGDHTIIRDWALTNNYGDIYLGVFNLPKVQVHGNALILLAFMVNFYNQKELNFKNIILLLGVICAGNFIFILILLLYLFIFFLQYLNNKIRNNKISKKQVVTIVFIIIVAIIPYIVTIMTSKAGDSNLTKIQQMEVLLDENIIFGNGLGNIINEVTPTRVYDGDIYFELQTFYIVNQIGIIGLFMFYYLILYPMIKGKKYSSIFIYILYIIYTFVNPYCFDSTQIIATIVVMNMINGDSYDNSTYNFI